MSSQKCSCDSKVLALEKDIRDLREEFEMAQSYLMELINNLTISVDSQYGYEDDMY